MINIGRFSNHYRPYAVKDYTVKHIIFFKDGQEILKTNSGWLEKTDVSKDRKYVELSGREDITGFTIPQEEIKKAVKVNLDKKESFFISVKEPYSKEKHCDLYVYVDGESIQVEDLGSLESLRSENEVRYLRTLKIKAPSFKYMEYVGTNVLQGTNRYELREVQEIFITAGGFETVLTETGKQLKEKIAEIKEVTGLDLSTYDLETLLKHFDVIRKQ